MWIRWNWIYTLNVLSISTDKIHPTSTSIFPGRTGTKSSNLFLKDLKTPLLLRVTTLLNTGRLFGNWEKSLACQNKKSTDLPMGNTYLKLWTNCHNWLLFMENTLKVFQIISEFMQAEF